MYLGQVLVDVQAERRDRSGSCRSGRRLSLPVRLLGQAAPGDILLSPEVGRLVEGWFILHGRQGPAEAGLSDAVGAYAVLGVGPRRSPLEVHRKRPLSRFVGRERELTMLLDLLAEVEQGRGQAVGIAGEPGVGKSRLCYEVAQLQRTHGWRILESSPAAYDKDTAYLPIVDLLKTYFHLDPRDDGPTMRDKVSTQLRTLDEALVPTLPAFLTLLDLPVEDPPWQALEPPQRRERLLEACKRLWLRASQSQPLLLIVENLHWIDTETQVLLDRLVDSLPTARLLLLVNYRPEYQPTWGYKTYYTRLRLDPLPHEKAQELLDGLLGKDPGLVPLKRHVSEMTAGNPFFLEETVQTLAESEVLVGERGTYRLSSTVGAATHRGLLLPQAIRLPTTVQAVLAARIDRLPPEDKRLLQTAAVVGTEVPLSLLQAIAELPEATLHDGLAHLQAAEFLYETRLFPEQVYTFKHALTHEVAYGSLLLERRRGLHGRLVEALEALAPERAAEQVERLAHHAVRGEVWAKAVPYCQQAGARAYDRAAFREAVTSFEQALQALAHLRENGDATVLAIELRLALGGALRILGEYRRQLALFGEAEALARALDDRARLGWVLAGMTGVLRVTGDHDGAMAAAQQALELAAELGDRALQVQASYNLAQAYQAIGDFGRAAELLRRNVEAADRESGAPDTDLRIASRAWLALTLSNLGAFAEGRRHGEEALRLATLAGRGAIPVVAHGCLGNLYLAKGDLKHAIRVLDQSLALCRASGNLDWLRRTVAGLGYASALQGRLAEGGALVEEAISESIRTGALQNQSRWVAWLSEVCRLEGRGDEAWQHARQAFNLAQRQKERGNEALALCQLGAVHAQADPPDVAQAEAHYQQAMALAEALGMRPLQAHCHLGLGTLYAKIGRHEPARAQLSTGIELYRSMEMTFWLPQAAAALERAG